MLTFTAPRDHSLTPNAATPAYLATIVRGLRQCHGLTEADAYAYLRAAGAAP